MVTGANSGIGKMTARALAAAGFTTVLMCRSATRAAQAREEIRRDVPGAELRVLLADLADLEQVRRLAERFGEQFDRLDVLVNNAGYLPGARELASPRFEKSFCVNHLAAFLLTALLLPRIKAAPAGRIVTVSSELHRLVKIPWDDLTFARRYGPYYAYCVGKLGNVMFTHELARRLAAEGCRSVTANALHPGYIRSEFGDDTHWYLRLAIRASRPFLLSPERAARTSIYLATAPEVAGISGKYFKACREARPSAYSRQPEACKRLWDLSAELTALH
jgi:NAD(P)-dependent dehydrogenase (short-subunit alcohol dehydrogenase family)